jgi:hypothetical protein
MEQHMTQQERHGWFIVASLFVILLLVFGGGYNTVPVLLPALLKGFPHWSPSARIHTAERPRRLRRRQRVARGMAG